MAKIKAQITKVREIEWNTRRVTVASLAGLAFCLPFIGIICMSAVLKFGWK